MTSSPKFDSKNSNMLVPMPKRRTVRRLSPRRRCSTHRMNPSIPPDAWVSVMIPPINAEKRSVRAFPGLVIASRKVLTPTTSPTTGFQEFKMVHPSHTNSASEM